MGGILPPTSRIGGILNLDGQWDQPLGLSILQIDDLVAGATFDLSKAAATGIPPPSSLILGAAVCVGSSSACIAKNDKTQYIEAAAYIGIDTAVPANNFFFAMISCKYSSTCVHFQT